MGRKFKVNDRVRVIATGEVGTVKGREVTNVDGTVRVKIEYIVKTGEGFNGWKAYNKKELELVRKEVEEPRTYHKVYDVVDGFKITMYTKVDNVPNWIGGGRTLRMGYSIYSPEDVYDEAKGVKIARKRSKVCPFCRMESDFKGEFNADTVFALMDVKADYIKNNFDRFIKRHEQA